MHGPNPRLTYKDRGKTVTESLPTPAAQKKAEREIAEFRRFEQLIRAFIEVNAKICRARSAEARAGVSGKKTTAAACEKASSQLEQQLQRIFADRHKTGQLDLEAAEMAIRSTVHQTGADAVTELLRLSPPDDDHRSIPCTCGRVARYEGMRSRPILTVVGWARIDRPYYLCPACHTGQFPADVELDIDKTDFSPGVRRMLAAVGGVAPFAQGRDQMKLLADLEVTAKTVERTAESIGEDIEIRQQKDIQSAKQLCLPAVAGPPIPYLYIQMDGTQVFVVKAETEGRAGRTPGQPARTRECKLGAGVHANHRR